jgi:hypothetical protein
MARITGPECPPPGPEDSQAADGGAADGGTEGTADRGIMTVWRMGG